MERGGRRRSSYRPSYPHDDKDRDRDFRGQPFQDRYSHEDEEQRLAFVRERDENARLARAERFALEAREIDARGSVPPHTPARPRSSIPFRATPASSRSTSFPNSIAQSQTPSRASSTVVKRKHLSSPLDLGPLPQKKVKMTVDSFVATDDRISIIVGKDDDRKKFEFKKEDLLSQSVVIRDDARSVDAEGREVSSSKVHYPQIKPLYFSILLAWIRTQDIDKTPLTDLADKATAGLSAWQTSAKKRWEELIESCRVAHKLQASAFHNAVINEMISLGRAYTQDFDVQDLMPKAELWPSMRRSALADFIFDLFVSQTKPETLEKMLWKDVWDGVGKFFAGDLMMRGFRAMKNPGISPATVPWEKVPCPYHRDFAAASDSKKR